MTRYILAIDQGTTSTRAILFDDKAKIEGVSQQELKLHYPASGWVEQKPDDIWDDTQFVCRSVLAHAGITPDKVAAIGITNQRETTIVWDKKTGKPVYNAIVWQDRRTAEMCAAFKAAGHEKTVMEKTGLLLDPYFSATKLRWILDHIPGLRGRAEAGEVLFGTIDCFLLWHLTGGQVHATDATNAARTMLFNIKTQAWDDELLNIFGVPRAMLPDVRDNSTHFGDATADFLGVPVPVTGMAGDQQAALIGQACFQRGMVKSTYGTGCFVLMNIGDQFRLSKNKLLTTIAYRLGGKTIYALEGSIFVAGAAVQWIRDGLGIIKSASETEALATSVPDNGGVYLVPAFTGLGAPYWNPDARAAITGLSRGSTSAHVARATLEAQAYQTEDLMQAMAEDAGGDFTELRVDGGMVKNNWICQFISDITAKPLLRPAIVETTALGAAYLAGLHIGIFPSLDSIADAWRPERTFTPAMKRADADALYAGWRGAVKKALA